MRERGDGDRFHVVGRHVVAPLQRSVSARELQQCERPARRRADLHTRRGPRRCHEVDHVEADLLRYVHLLERALHREECRGIFV